MPAWGGLDVPSLGDLRELAKRFTDGWLADFLKDGWDAVTVMAAPSRAFKLGLPTSQSLSGLVGMPRAPGTPPPPSQLIVITAYGTAGTSNFDILDGYGLMQAVNVGAGAGAGTRAGAVGSGGGAGACCSKSVPLAPTGNGTLSVVRGAAGTGAVSGTADGTDGADSTISGGPLTTPMVAGGGKKGLGATTPGGLGGTATGGDANRTGGPGGDGSASAVTPPGGGGAAGPTADGAAGSAAGGTTGTAGTGTAGGGGSGNGTTGNGASGGGGVNQPGGWSLNSSTPFVYQANAGGEPGFCPPAEPGQSLYAGSAPLAAQGKNGGKGGGGGGSSQGNQSGNGGIGTAAILLAA